jgi:ADP-ribose pyrophosphatase
MRETKLSTERIYDGRIVKLDLHDVRLPNGEQSKREIVSHPGAVAVVPLDADQTILLVRQYRMAADRILLEVPAGTLDPGEAPEICAERELQEEAGYKPGRLTPLGGIFAAPGYTTEFIHLFLATDLQVSSLELDDDEFIEVVRVPLVDALQMIDSGEIVDSKTVAILLRTARYLGI